MPWLELFNKNKDNLTEITTETLQELTGDDALLAEQVKERAKFSMGNDLSPVDEKSLVDFARYVVEHYDYKRQLQSYLKDQMTSVAPNLTELLGESVGARLMTHAGGLNNLAKLPASTIQILGAEKALFRALKTKSATPKYGLLFNSTYISRATTARKGKVSRLLSNACAKASRLDNFLIKVI